VQEIIRFDTEFLAAADANQSSAAIYQLCAKSLSPQWSAFEFDTCFDNCTATFCPQPAWKFMTEAKAEACAKSAGISWKAVSECSRTPHGADLLAASLNRSHKECPGCPGPTVMVNGQYAGHHPGADPILAVICGNYTGTKPKGCPATQTTTLAPRL
jgi:hypothetical protein